MYVKGNTQKENDRWIFESYVGGIGWSFSRLNETYDAHTLDWCLEQWQRFKKGEMADEPLGPLSGNFGIDNDGRLFTEVHRYRLRNIETEDIIMCAIL